MYRGFWGTFLRDIPGYSVYFASYEWIKEYGKIKQE